eukprot:scaffold21730_cov116-Skeletonema_dohrnii-CCMP3373.AAC.6
MSRSLCSSARPGRRMALGCQLVLSLENCAVRKISRQGRWLNYLIGCSSEIVGEFGFTYFIVQSKLRKRKYGMLGKTP